MRISAGVRVRGRAWTLGVLWGVASLILVGCGSSSTASTQLSGTPIKLGVLDDVAPNLPIEGAEMRVNTDLAVAQINAAGGIHGHRVDVVYANPKGDPAEAVNLAQQLVQQDGVDVLLGGVLSSECLGIGNLVPRLQVLYLASTGCASADLTAKQCNKYTFRVQPTGTQGIIPLSTYIVSTYGTKWAIMYSDYALGQSQLAAYTAGLKAASGEITKKIAVPLGETNVTPYVTQVPTDGSVNGLIDAQVGADLLRGTQVLSQFSVGTKVPIVGIFGKERFAGVYPDSITGSLGQGYELSDAPSGNKYDTAYHSAFRAQLAKEDQSVITALGGLDKAVPGALGYQAYTALTALKRAMLSANFTGKADTQKLISALEGLRASQGSDFPAGDVAMNASDHQGRMTLYIVKINGQKEEVLKTLTPGALPPIGTCQVS